MQLSAASMVSKQLTAVNIVNINTHWPGEWVFNPPSCVSYGLPASNHACDTARWRDCGVLMVSYGLIIVLPVNKCGCLLSVGILSL